MLAAVAFAAIGYGASGQAEAQNPLFPNTQPTYYNPYGIGPYGRYRAAGNFPLQPLPAAYSQPLPTPGAGYRNVYPINPVYGGRAYTPNFYGNSAYYNPYRY